MSNDPSSPNGIVRCKRRRKKKCEIGSLDTTCIIHSFLTASVSRKIHTHAFFYKNQIQFFFFKKKNEGQGNKQTLSAYVKAALECNTT